MFFLFPLGRDRRWLDLKRPYHICQSQRQRVLGESRPRAYPSPGAEGEVVACIRVGHCGILGCPLGVAYVALGFELEWIRVSHGIEMDCRCVTDDSGAFGDDQAFVHDIVVGKMPQDPWRGRTQAPDFFEAGIDVGQIGKVIVRGDTRVTDNLLKLLECLGLGIGRRSKIEDQVAECCCRRL